MKNKKRFFAFALVLPFLFIPLVKAEEYYRLNTFKSDGVILSNTYSCGENNEETCTYFPIINQYYDNGVETNKGELYLMNWYMTQEYSGKSFSMNLVSNDLDSEKIYVVSLKSDYIDESNTYTGSELNEGIEISITETYGKVELHVTEEETNTEINFMKFNCDGAVGECDTENDTPVASYESIVISFNFGNQSSTPEMPEATEEQLAELDEILKQITTTGVIELDALEPTNPDYGDSMITSALSKKYQIDGYELYGYSYEGKDYLNIQLIENYNVYKQYEVEYKYATPNEEILKIVEETASKLDFTWADILQNYNNRFIVEDLESINYLYNIQRTKNPIAAMNSIVNYSSKIHELADNANIDFMFDIRAGGGDSEFAEMVIGPMNILYDGIVYTNVDPVGYSLTKIIYVPDNTEKTRDAFISAAKSRINEYLKGIDVEITYGGKISDLDEIQYSWEKYDQETQTWSSEPLFDLDKTNGEWYIIKIGNEEYKYFIVQGSDNMNTPYVKTMDVNTNVYVTTDAFDAPLDSRLSATKLDTNSEEYKQLMSKLNITDGVSYNLNLYSTSLDMYVSKLSDGKFEVYIPVDSSYNNKTLVAYYLKEDGTVEEYEVTVENGYAIFKTDHFSTYTLVETSTNNPKTGDQILKYVGILTISTIGIAGVTIYLKKNKNLV